MKLVCATTTAACVGGAYRPPAANPHVPQGISQSWVEAPPCLGTGEKGGPGLTPPQGSRTREFLPPAATSPRLPLHLSLVRRPVTGIQPPPSCLDRVITGYYTDHLHGHLQVISITLSYLSAHFVPHNICLIRLLCSLSMLQ